MSPGVLRARYALSVIDGDWVGPLEDVPTDEPEGPDEGNAGGEK